MSYLITHFWPGTEEQYQTTVAAVTEAAGASFPRSSTPGVRRTAEF